MDTEMIIVNKLDLRELIDEVKTLNENFKNLNLKAEDKTVFTREQAKEFYHFSDREVSKIYNKLLKEKVVNIGKTTRLAKVHIDDLMEKGVILKHV